MIPRPWPRVYSSDSPEAEIGYRNSCAPRLADARASSRIRDKGPGQYFLYRSAVYALVSVPLVMALHELLGVVTLAPGPLVAIALATLPIVPLTALVVGAFAGNQVEAFAVAKGSGFLFTGPAAAFFIPRQWDLLVGILPTYWPVKAYFAAIEGPPELFWAALALSVVYPSACAVFLYRLFRRRAMSG